MNDTAKQKTLSLHIVTREGAVREGVAVAVNVPAVEGRLTVLPGHAPLICALDAGVVEVRGGNAEPERWHIEAGVLEVGADEVVLIVPAARSE